MPTGNGRKPEPKRTTIPAKRNPGRLSQLSGKPPRFVRPFNHDNLTKVEMYEMLRKAVENTK